MCIRDSVSPSSVSLTVSPPAATLGASQSIQFAALVSGAGNTAVIWSMTPSIGTLSASGMYTAPPNTAATQTVAVTATCEADSTKSATAEITLAPVGQYSVSFALVGSTSVKVSWTAPSGRPASDWIGLSSVGAPGYWYTWSQNTGGAAAGSMVLNLPSSPGIWVFRYYTGSNYTIAATSAPLSVGVSGFSVGASPGTVAAGAPLTVTWTAPAGRPAGDSIGLFRVGVSNVNPTTTQYVNGLSLIHIYLPTRPQRRERQSGGHRQWTAFQLAAVHRGAGQYLFRRHHRRRQESRHFRRAVADPAEGSRCDAAWGYHLCHEPVSYTHLDVYKRQILYCSAARRSSRVADSRGRESET